MKASTRTAVVSFLMLSGLVVGGLGCVIHSGGCGGAQFMSTQGSGVSKTETREVAEFRSIKLNGSAKVNVTIGQPQQVTITADDNVLPLIQTDVAGGELTIGTKESYSSKVPVQVSITVASLTDLELNGSGDIRITGLNEKKFKTVIRGSGDLTAHGQADSVEVSIKGSGNIHLQEVVAKNASVSIAGSGDAEVSASESLDASIAGSGDIRYKGNPPKVQKSVAGSGKIRPM